MQGFRNVENLAAQFAPKRWLASVDALMYLLCSHG
jgi:hypothetical protein